MSEYVKYQHVEKLDTDETEGITIGECFVFPKIDGTNGQVWFEAGQLRYGSRRREVSLGDDNQGFAAWCEDNKYELLTALSRLPNGARIFGEWLVPHSLKTYREDAWRNFYVFDVMLTDGRYMPYNEYNQLIGQELTVIDPIRILVNPKRENILRCLDENHFLMPSPEHIGEGVVIKNYDFTNKYGRQVWAKVVTTEFKEKHIKEMGAPVTKCADYIEQDIVEQLFTKEIADKVEANIRTGEGWNSKKIPQFLGRCFHDFVTECTWQAVKDHKNPAIDFKLLQRFVFAKAKQHCPHLF